MFWTSCFYVMIALISLYFINKFKTTKKTRRVYSRTDLLEKNKLVKLPEDWIPIEKAPESTKGIVVPDKVNVVSENKETTEVVKEETLESFILKEIEISVKELEQKRKPFGKIDNNARVNRLNPSVEEFLPKVRLNPMAEDFNPYS